MSAPPKDVDPSKLSDRENRFLIYAIQSMRGGEQRLDYPRLAAAAGLSNPKAAMDAWCRLKKKFELSFGDASTAGPAATAATKAPAKPRKRKAAAQLAKAESGSGSENEAEANACIASAVKTNKKTKTAKTVKSAKTAKDESTDEDCKDFKDCKDYEEEDDSA